MLSFSFPSSPHVFLVAFPSARLFFSLFASATRNQKELQRSARHGYRFASCSSGKEPAHLLSFFSSSFFLTLSLFLSQLNGVQAAGCQSESAVDTSSTSAYMLTHKFGRQQTVSASMRPLLATAPHRSTLEYICKRCSVEECHPCKTCNVFFGPSSI